MCVCYTRVHTYTSTQVHGITFFKKSLGAMLRMIDRTREEAGRLVRNTPGERNGDLALDDSSHLAI